MHYCPRCEGWTAYDDPEKRTEVYCSVAGCGWQGTRAAARVPEQRVADLQEKIKRLRLAAEQGGERVREALRLCMEFIYTVRGNIDPIANEVMAKAEAALSAAPERDERRHLVELERRCKGGILCGHSYGARPGLKCNSAVDGEAALREAVNALARFYANTDGGK